MIDISIAIPCYEMNGYGGNFLEYSFSKIYAQRTYRHIEVVVSDHSIDNGVLDICNKWKDYLDIKYLRNDVMRGSSSHNVNNCIRNSSGELIKILCQDDYLFDNDSIEETIKAFTPDKHWLVTNYIHTYDRNTLFNEHEPKLNDDLMFTNSIGTHSCLTIRNKDLIYFDDNLIWFMDCELYTRLLMKFGDPIFLKRVTMVQTLWNGQVTHTLADQTLRDKEYLYLKQNNNVEKK